MRLINAEEAIEIVIKYAPAFDVNTLAAKSWFIAVLKSENLTPTVEPKRGRWIKRDAWMPGSELATKYFPFQDCSECGWSYRIKILSEFKFCPNCGAKMEGETDGDA